VPAEGLRPWQARAWALVLATIVESTVSRMIATVGSFPWVAIGASAGVDGVACVAVVVETLMYRGRSALPSALWCLVD
jgi:ketopantoate hydroxymethyltransferase